MLTGMLYEYVILWYTNYSTAAGCSRSIDLHYYVHVNTGDAVDHAK